MTTDPRRLWNQSLESLWKDWCVSQEQAGREIKEKLWSFATVLGDMYALGFSPSKSLSLLVKTYRDLIVT